MFEELVGKRVCAVYREGETVRTALGVVGKTTADKFLRVVADDGAEFLIHSESLVKLKTKDGGDSE